MAEPILEIRQLNKSFGPVHVLHDIDLAIYPGEVTALVGDNGAGKSTLVKCIAGINSLDSGTVYFEGKPVTQAQVKSLAALPSKTQLLAQLGGALQAPMAGFLGVLNGVLYSMVGALEALKTKRAGEQ